MSSNDLGHSTMRGVWAHVLLGVPALVAIGVVYLAGPGSPLPALPSVARATPMGPPAAPALALNCPLVWIKGPARGQGFFLSQFEITNAQYIEFVRATGYDGSDHPSSKATEAFLAHVKDGVCPPELLDHPACNLNWHHAVAFCEWLAAESGVPVRLPTDAEWQWAASGREGRAYPWGDRWDPTRCNWGDNTGGDRFGLEDDWSASAPVGSFPTGATPEGVQDMAGNIWEWTTEGHLRGGPWCLDPGMMRCDRIGDEGVDQANDKFGFRILVERPAVLES